MPARPVAARFDLAAQHFAHRGLWSPDGPPENTLPAFEAAIAAGHGVELDVQLTADGEAVVIHDPVLDRLTDASGLVQSRSLAELTDLAVAGSHARIPSLADALAVLARCPVLVEIKADAVDPHAIARAAARDLARHDGPAMAMSFNAEVRAALDALLPELGVGQLVAPAGLVGAAPLEARLGAADGAFIALPWRDAEAGARLLAGRPTLAWTVASQDALAASRPYVTSLIFEHVDPGLAGPSPAR